MFARPEITIGADAERCDFNIVRRFAHAFLKQWYVPHRNIGKRLAEECPLIPYLGALCDWLIYSESW